MTDTVRADLFEATDPRDRRLALRADGVLREFNEAGVLTAGDIHVAQRIGVLGGEPDPQVLLAVALATRAVRHGAVCLDLAEVVSLAPDLAWPEPAAWAAAVTDSPLVEAGVLRWEFDLLYLDRYWRQEVQVCADLVARAEQAPPPVDEAVLEAALDRAFGGAGYAEQRAATDRAARQWTTVLTGGPGTGKTTTVAGLLAILTEQATLAEHDLRIALTAPTGKAAARLQEAVLAETARLPAPDRERLTGSGLEASTLHRLLGTRWDNGTRFRHHRGNRLPHDLVVVDETSMVSLTMMTRLLEALRSDARLVLVGDPDQLASVDAGAVLADLVAGFSAESGTVAALVTNHRSESQDLNELAAAVRDGREQDALAVLEAEPTGVRFVTDDPASAIRDEVLAAALAVRAAAESGDAAGALAALDAHRLLCAHRRGPHGVTTWNRHVEQWITDATGDPLWDTWYVGRPVLVTANDYGLGLHNGDIGVAVRREDGELRVVLQTATGLRDFAPSRLSDVETMHAMTIHKAQGSQADRVTVLLPPEESRLLNRELLYTAITRAKHGVSVVGDAEAVRLAVQRRAVRASGLKFRLRGD